MNKSTLILLLTSSLSMVGCGSGGKSGSVNNSNNSNSESTTTTTSPTYPTTVSTVSEHWQLVWQDEFDGNDIDLSKWSFEQNCYGGGNNEKQCYTNRPDNAFIEQGVLVLQALREDYTGPAAQDDDPAYNVNVTRTLPYTSARLRSKGKGDWTYGRFEIRAKLPKGQGTWPAIWMLPTDWVYGGWAGSGEIDIMEAVNLGALSDELGAPSGSAEVRVHGTLHYGRAWPSNVYTGTGYALPERANPADDFHVYAVEWQAGEIRWYVDNVHFATQRANGWYTQYSDSNGQLVNGTGNAPFDQNFHLLLNFAVGGSWSEAVNERGVDSSVFPQRFEIDYVRVYQCAAPDSSVTCATEGPEAKLVEGKTAPAL